MSKVRQVLAASAVATLPLGAAAQGSADRDFFVNAQHFQAGAIPGATARDVDVFCRDDFNWRSDPATPTAQLMERIDTQGFGGGEPSNIAFLLMGDAEREAYLDDLSNAWAKASLQRSAHNFDSAPSQQARLEQMQQMLKENHGWNEGMFGQIAGECERRSLDRN